MAAVDPYSPCPCGSGQKFKWCCQKVQPYAEKAQRFFEAGQVDSALSTLDEGLRKAPENPWLLTRKASLLMRQSQFAEARPLLEQVLSRQPDHAGAAALLIQSVALSEGPLEAAARLQQLLTTLPPERRRWLQATTGQLIGALMSRFGLVPSAIKHLQLAAGAFEHEDEDPAQSALASIESDPRITPWLRNPYELSPAPDGLSEPNRERFTQALEWAGEGLWSSAAAAFETLSADGVGPEADRNLGLCRLWLADDAAAVEALRRFIAQVGPTIEAVDLEALCQLVAPLGADDLVERVQLLWPLRDREALLTALQAQERVQDDGTGPIDSEDPDSAEVDQFVWLDRPRLKADAIVREPAEVPRALGRVLVGQELAVLEVIDDGRLDSLRDQFTELAGAAIAPAHPRTKVVGSLSRVNLALQTEWALPEELSATETARLYRQERERLLREVWPETPLPYLGGRTPAQAAQDGNAEVPLRAAVFQIELGRESLIEGSDFSDLRQRLGLTSEPELDPETVEVPHVHLARLHSIPADRLDDDRLLELYRRSRETMMPQALERSARALVDRPALLAEGRTDTFTVYSDLASLMMTRGDSAAAFDWLGRGRRATPPAQQASLAPRWDLLEVRLRSRSEAPESWVPHLAVLLERYGNHPAAGQLVVMNLLEMGLLQAIPNPDRPSEMMIDSRPLQMVLQRYGPRVTTASGDLGVSASSGGIWTPGSSSGGSGGLWTPGSSSGPASGGGEKPRLIIPGR